MRTAIQLHSVRDLNEPLPAVLHRVSDAGFEGVEFAGRLRHADPDAVATALAETGLVPMGGHVEFSALRTDPEQIMDRFETIGCTRIVIPHLPATHFRTRGRIDQLAETFTEVADTLHQRGFELVYHNTRHDLAPPLTYPLLDRLVDKGLVPGAVESLVFEPLRVRQTAAATGDTGIGYLAASTGPSELSFEIDAGEVAAASRDQDDVYEFFGERLAAVHICDVTDASDGYQSTSPGTGVLDLPDVFAAAERHGVEWVVYEHDHPTDPVETIERGATAVLEPVQRQRPPSRISQ